MTYLICFLLTTFWFIGEKLWKYLGKENRRPAWAEYVVNFIFILAFCATMQEIFSFEPSAALTAFLGMNFGKMVGEEWLKHYVPNYLSENY